jgi:MFS family permease
MAREIRRLGRQCCEIAFARGSSGSGLRSTQVDGRRVVTATIVTVLNNSMITVVLAAVGRDLSATPSALGWTATGYLLPFAAGNALAGLLSDRVSLRRVFTLGLIVFAVGTVAAATAPSATWLIIARGVQGAGGSVVPALSAVAIARVFEAGRRGPVFGLLAAGTGAAQAAGPVLGGALGEVAGWRSLFWVSTALVVPVLIGAARTLAAVDHSAATSAAELIPAGLRVACRPWPGRVRFWSESGC